MKNVLTVGRRALLGAALGVATIAATAIPAVAQEYKWRLQANVDSSNDAYVAVQNRLADLVTEMSGGRMEIELYPVGALFPVADGLEAVGSGVTEMAMLTGSYFTGKIGPVASIESGVPGGTRTTMERFNFFYKKGFIDVARKAFAPYDVYYLGPQIQSGWDLVSKKPITSMKDFEGLKVRAYGLEADWYRSMGASPTFLPGNEIYTALATGVIDAARWGTPAGNLQLSLQEVADYYIQPSSLPAPNNFFAVNQSAWDALPDDLKAILREAVILCSLDVIMEDMNGDGAARAKLIEAGMEFVTIPEEEFTKMEARAREIWADYASEDELAAEAVEMLQSFLSELGRGS